MTFCSIILCVITDGLVSFIQSTVGRVKIKMDEGHGMPDLECDGCHQVLNCREAFEVPGFPVSVSIGSLLDCQEGGGKEDVLHPTMEKPAA